MQHIQSKNRHQIEFTGLEDTIEKDNPVRFIDAFVDKLELIKIRIYIKHPQKRRTSLV